MRSTILIWGHERRIKQRFYLQQTYNLARKIDKAVVIVYDGNIHLVRWVKLGFSLTFYSYIFHPSLHTPAIPDQVFVFCCFFFLTKCAIHIWALAHYAVWNALPCACWNPVRAYFKICSWEYSFWYSRVDHIYLYSPINLSRHFIIVWLRISSSLPQSTAMCRTNFQ